MIFFFNFRRSAFWYRNLYVLQMLEDLLEMYIWMDLKYTPREQ